MKFTVKCDRRQISGIYYIRKVYSYMYFPIQFVFMRRHVVDKFA